MGIGNLGFSEMLVIAVLVLIFFGPRRMPEIGRTVGGALREFRRGLNEIQRELQEAERAASVEPDKPSNQQSSPPASPLAAALGTTTGTPAGAPAPKANDPPAPEGQTEPDEEPGSDEEHEPAEEHDPVDGAEGIGDASARTD